MRSQKLRVVISGSFQKHFSVIKNAIEKLNYLGIEVLSPKMSEIINPGEDFVILTTDVIKDPKELEEAHLENIRKADALYIVNPGGYIGLLAAMELGWARAFSKPVFAQETPQDVTLKQFVDGICEVEDIEKYL